MEQEATLLSVQDLSVGFADSRGAFLAVNQVSFTVRENQTLGLLGESGCGKSVTLRAILRLLPYPGKVVAGKVEWQGKNLAGASKRELEDIRGKDIAMIFQDPTACLNPVFTVGSQMTETLRLKLGVTDGQARARAAELLDHVGIPSPRERLLLYPHQLSGGMRQRVMIALAIAAQPRLLLADEPTTALDVTIQDQILSLLARLKTESAMSMILVSHDVGVIAQNSDLVAVMYAGQIMEAGGADEVLRTPRHPYTQSLLAAIPHLDAAGSRKLLYTIPGQPPSLAHLPKGCPFQARCPHVQAQCEHIRVQLDRPFPEHGSACPVIH